MAVYSGRIFGWHFDYRMTTDMDAKAMIKTVNLRQTQRGLGVS